MAKGENIFRRRDGRWEARYIKGRELSGKIKYGYCYLCRAFAPGRLRAEPMGGRDTDINVGM